MVDRSGSPRPDGSEEGGRKKLSVAIIAQNEQERIVKAIESCRSFADEIVVVDGGSTDRTAEIAAACGCSVYHNPWPGYAKQRNFAAGKARHDWILMLDTDEFPDEELIRSIHLWKLDAGAREDAYRLYRIGNFMGKWLDRGEYLVRLYDRRRISVVDTPVHEAPDVGGRPVGTLPGILWHDGFRSIEDHVIRFNRYTNLEAEKAFAAGKPFRLYRLLARPSLRFVQKYFVQGLFRKGLAGLTIAVLWSYYEYLAQIKHYEKRRLSAGGRTPAQHTGAPERATPVSM
ncbi:glycosyltransferase family 2 protein [Paenibacillus thermoaerophilus]|nr:glycosyltransferase family 2 protein [Paenibacillus thermoaerophilus]